MNTAYCANNCDSAATQASGVKGRNSLRIGIVWNQFGPYHIARVQALCEAAKPSQVIAFEFSTQSWGYQWQRTEAPSFGLIPMCSKGNAEQLGFWRLFFGAQRVMSACKLQVCLVPGYWPKQPLAVLLAAWLLGIRTVMMNDSHAGTSRATGTIETLKRLLVRHLFGAALVAGSPHRRHFVSLGFSEDRVFTGYDAVNNDYFANRADEVRRQDAWFRAKHGLPAHYFMGLGRMIEKKNFNTLIRAYELFLRKNPKAETHLVLVGAGVSEMDLRILCRGLGLRVFDHEYQTAQNVPQYSPAVHFYSFRQVSETPEFYALADAFIMPSRHEEWGLVVNEAMACGTPVVVSEKAGCAEDLLPAGWPGGVNDHYRSIVEEQELNTRIRQSGFVFDANSSIELSRILQTLEASPELRGAMAQSCREIVQRFSCQNFAANALLAVRRALDN